MNDLPSLDPAYVCSTRNHNKTIFIPLKLPFLVCLFHDLLHMLSHNLASHLPPMSKDEPLSPQETICWYSSTTSAKAKLPCLQPFSPIYTPNNSMEGRNSLSPHPSRTPSATQRFCTAEPHPHASMLRSSISLDSSHIETVQKSFLDSQAIWNSRNGSRWDPMIHLVSMPAQTLSTRLHCQTNGTPIVNFPHKWTYLSNDNCIHSPSFNR